MELDIINHDQSAHQADCDIIVYKLLTNVAQNTYGVRDHFVSELNSKVASVLRLDDEGNILSGLFSYGDPSDIIGMTLIPNEAIVRCIIPKGSLYVSAAINDIEGYVSDELIYSNPINLKTNDQIN